MFSVSLISALVYHFLPHVGFNLPYSVFKVKAAVNDLRLSFFSNTGILCRDFCVHFTLLGTGDFLCLSVSLVVVTQP